MSDDADGPLDTLTALVAVATLPVGILAGIFVGGQAAGIVFVVGWLLLLPVLGVLDDHLATGDSTDESAFEDTSSSEDDALQRLRERYASGEIDEAEFERRLERLLETEDLDPDAEGVPGPRRGSNRDVSTDRDVELE